MSNRRRTAPIYLQLARRIQDRIDSGALPAGSRLPSEPELCEEFDVNRLTIRQAIAELERAASVEIRRGVGTFVRSPIARVSIAVDPRSQRFDLGSLTTAVPHGATDAGDVEGGTERITAVVPAPRTPADTGAAGHLRCDPAELSRLESVIVIGTEPWGVNSYWLKSSLLPEELSAPRRVDNVVRVLARSAGIVLEYDWRAFSAIGADIGDADLLGVPAGAPLLVREGVSCTPDGEPVLFVRRRINGERARFVLNFRPDEDG
ncbi:MULTISPECIES: GntR family transcriptional regulator [unclassified Streptomyces]|uniref:GntR family transcriptional regulator n=1 Tax=unclassified Streptomyces TaxID=2593676 RepID=UPI0037F9767B